MGPLATVALVPWLIVVWRSGPGAAALISIATGVAYAAMSADWLYAAFQSQGAHGFRGVLGVLVAALWGKGLLSSHKFTLPRAK